jgi:hypothetical protein
MTACEYQGVYMKHNIEIEVEGEGDEEEEEEGDQASLGEEGQQKDDSMRSLAMEQRR